MSTSNRPHDGDGESSPLHLVRKLLESLAGNREPCEVRIRPQGRVGWKSVFALPAGAFSVFLDVLDLLDEAERDDGAAAEQRPGSAADVDMEAEADTEDLPPRGRRDASGHTALQTLILGLLKKSNKPLYLGTIARRLSRRDSGGLRRAVLELVERHEVEERDGMFSWVKESEGEGE